MDCVVRIHNYADFPERKKVSLCEMQYEVIGLINCKEIELEKKIFFVIKHFLNKKLHTSFIK